MVESLFERVLAILGMPEADPAFVSLVQELDDDPYIAGQSKSSCHYILRGSGLGLTYDRRNGYFSGCFFHYGSAMALNGQVSKYRGNLPCEINFGDSNEDVQQKLAMSPTKSSFVPAGHEGEPESLWQTYKHQPFRFTFMFSPPDMRLSSFSVNYEPPFSTARVAARNPESYLLDASTEEVLRMLSLAAAHCRRFGGDTVDSGHLLLALLLEAKAPLAEVLTATGLKVDKVKDQVEKMTHPARTSRIEEMSYSPAVKLICEEALEQANNRGYAQVHLEQVLIGILEVGEGIATRVFQIFEIDTEALQRKLVDLSHDG